MWYGIGILQYHFLVGQGLLNEHRFIDIGCGALRLGQYLIPYLDSNHYFGLDAEPELIEKGLEFEIPTQLVRLKKPSFSVNHEFDFSFIDGFDYAMAQSVFTHLTQDDIKNCLSRLRSVSNSNSRLYFSFFEGDSSQNEHVTSHANLCWQYSKEEFEKIGNDSGWSISYIGNWGHPRNQMMMLATIRP
jgi:SAM-dependent methyltransferase